MDNVFAAHCAAPAQIGDAQRDAPDAAFIEQMRERFPTEREIDAMNEELSPLASFILPGGSKGVAALHLARAIVRRAERAAVALSAEERINPPAATYLNRLSDHLFVAARSVAAGEGGDVLWRPGATRDD